MTEQERVVRVRRSAILRPVAVWLGLAALLLSAGCAAGGGSHSLHRRSGSSPTTTLVHLVGGTVEWAQPPSGAPNYIFPFMSLQFWSISNTEDFQYLMYRPLYWFGAPGQPRLDAQPSLADPPSFSGGDTEVTIHLRPYRFSNGTALDARSVIFFLNMLRAEKQNFGPYVPGGLPDDLASVVAKSAGSDTIVLKLASSVNPIWFTDNELSQITPLPEAWDVSRLVRGRPAPPGSGGCSALRWSAGVASSCEAVYSFLAGKGEAADMATYASNPLWSIVDGPWRLASFSPRTGRVVMEPNPRYSGPVRPSISRFVEVPFSTMTMEARALERAGSSIDVGYLAPQDLPPAPRPGAVGPNAARLAGRYRLMVEYPWQIDYSVLNFDSSGVAGLTSGPRVAAGYLFRQLYIRQALQELIDQPGLIRQVYRNYAEPTVGPVPLLPPGPLNSAEHSFEYSYDPAAAKALLRRHGWRIEPGGTDRCARRAGCGAHIPRGAQLSLYGQSYPGTSPSFDAIVRRDFASAGVRIYFPNLEGEVFNAYSRCSLNGPECRWEIASAGGWQYEPDYFPSGEQTFSSRASGDFGNYKNAENDRLIQATLHHPGTAVLLMWENFLSRQLPVLWLPTPAAEIVEVKQGLQGVAPNPEQALTPEVWYFTARS